MEIKGLFEGGSLTPETQKAIEESFQAALVVKEAELATQYDQKLTEAKQELTETMMQLVNESIEEEMQEILEEVKHARTLEVQYAEKLQTFKESYAQKTDETMKLMVAESIQEEMAAIAEEVETIKKYEFVMGIFEQFKGTYERLFGGMDIDVVEALEESRKELSAYKRKEAIDNLLEGLTGSKKEVARTILESVETDKLEEKFNSVKHILLAETAISTEATLTESVTEEVADEVNGTVVLENELVEEKGEGEVVTESATIDPVALKLQRSLKLAKVR